MLKNNIAGIVVKNKLKITGVAKAAICILSGFLFAQATIGETPSPLIVSLISSLSLIGGFCAAIGALFAYFICGNISSAAIEIGAVVIIMVAKIVICDILGREVRILGKALQSGSAELISGVIFSFLTTLTGGGIFVILCRAILCSAATYFLTVTIRSAKDEGHLVTNGICGGSLGMVTLFFIASMCSITTDIFCFGRAVAVFFILTGAKKWSYSGGALCGIIALCGITLYSSDYGHASMMLPMAGIIAGIFSNFNSLIQVLFFVLANAVGMVLIGVSPETAKTSVDIIAGCSAFVLIPDRFISSILGIDGFSKVTKNVMEQVSSRLTFAADSVAEIRRDVQKISTTLSKKNQDNDLSVRVCEKVCRNCRNNMECWEKNFDRTYDGFEKAKKIVMENVRISVYEFPFELDECLKKTDLAKEFGKIYKEQIFEERTEEKLNGMRNILDEQFISMEALLGDTAEQIQSSDAIDEKLSEEVRTFISDFGGRIVKGNVYKDKQGILRIEAFYSGEVGLDEEELAEELSDITGVNISSTQLTSVNGVYKLSATERPKFDVEFNIFQRDGKEDYSGDAFESFEDGKGNRYFIIADGMGSGKLAAVDSKMSVSFFKRLICGGAGLETAIRIINSSVKVKPNDESFSTLDILKINLYNGNIEIVKMGSAPSFIRTDGRVLMFQEKTFPIGIMDDISVNRNKFNLKNGDFVLMMTDGIGSDFYPEIRKLLSVKKEIDSKEFYDNISNDIDNNIDKTNSDDITLLCVKLVKSIEKSNTRNSEKIFK